MVELLACDVTGRQCGDRSWVCGAVGVRAPVASALCTDAWLLRGLLLVPLVGAWWLLLCGTWLRQGL